MFRPMRIRPWLLRLWVVLTAGTLQAGESGLNVIVVVNQNSADSVQLGNDYCEKRGVPPQNLFRVTGWTNGAVVWNRTDFETLLRNPLLAMLAARGLTNQAEVVLLSMDIPYIVEDNGSYNSTTAVLFYGFKYDAPPPLVCLPQSCSLPDGSSNSYAFSELPFFVAPPNTATTNAYLAMMLTASNLNTAELILARGVASDSTFPTQTVYLEQTSDPARNVRFIEFDNAILAARVRGDNSLVWINSNSTSFTNILGLLTGMASLSLPNNAFVAGAMGDSLTSFGGQIFQNSGQTSVLAFLAAGAAGSYGTIAEPCNYTQKFPDPRDYFYQNRGFCLAEAYYQSLLNPYQGLLAGEPLSAPFARPGTGDWTALTNGSFLSGLVNLTPVFSAAATNLPLGRVDLFLDGTFLKTLTNLPPTVGNTLSVTLNGITITDAVPANATSWSVATNLAALLNTRTNSTSVLASAVGDRLELQSLNVGAPGSSVALSAATAIGSATQLTTLLTPGRPTFVDGSATGYLGILVSNIPVVGDWLELDLIKTNGAMVSVSVTNTASGTSIATLVQNLVNNVNADPALQSADGVLASDFSDDTFCGIVAAQFTLYARSAGWAAAEIQVTLTASTNLLALPSGTNRLEDNLTDLRPRNHLYISSGLSSLVINGVFDTTQLSDGFHQLTAVAYEGTSVNTQTRVSRNVRIQNASLMATFTPSVAGTNAPLNMPLQFAVTANTTNVSRIELFSTGGSIGVVSNQSSAVLTVPSAMLGAGLHPFYAVVTDSAGHRYQTETDWLRLVPFILTITASPLTVSWAAIPGQQYDVLTTTNLALSFQKIASVTATNAVAQWPVPGASSSSAPAFYRVRFTP